MRNFHKIILSSSLIFGITILGVIGCGGGGGSSTPPPPPPPPSIAVSPGSATVALNGTQQFSATNPSSGTGALVPSNWSVNNVSGGNATVGTIDQNGKYIGPATFPSSNTITITAASQADATKTATATVTVVFPSDNARMQTVPVKLGTSGGNVTDSVTSGSTTTCCSGTLGALVVRNGTFFILSNNHVLDKSDTGKAGDQIGQPGLVDNNCNPGTPVATLSQSAALKPTSGTTGPAPSNVDAAIAQIISAATVDTTGAILDLGTEGASSIAPAPPSSTPAIPATVLSTNERVAKSGRSTGLTCSTLQSISTSVSVDYDVACGGAKAFTSTFSNQVIVNGGTFSSSGDSGSLIVTADTARPVALLYAGNSTTSTGNPIADVLAAFQSGPNAATIVGGGDHAVSCAPTTTTASATSQAPTASSTLTTEELDRATAMKERHAGDLMRDPAISRVGVGISDDNPKEAALTIFVSGTPEKPIPAQLEGVRTKLIYTTQVPALTLEGIKSATTVKDARVRELMAQEGIMGVGVGRSEDGPGEPALVVYVEQGKLRSSIPAEIDGVRTKIVEGDRFRAFGWGHETKPVACVKPQKSQASRRAKTLNR
ncbi:MAG TPA: hypothetical protein VNV88_12080 [Candidatus Solibacter sp.]|nr:hypothetical protein [Candidatus Solibacter sp.]